MAIIANLAAVTKMTATTTTIGATAASLLFTKFPVELIYKILETVDEPAALVAFAGTCHDAYGIYQSIKPALIQSFLAQKLGPAFADALALEMWQPAPLNPFAPGYGPAVRRLVYDYGKLLRGPAPSRRTHRLSLTELYNMLRTARTIHRMVNLASMTVISSHDDSRDAIARERLNSRDLPVDEASYHQLLRGFYRRQICVNAMGVNRLIGDDFLNGTVVTPFDRMAEDFDEDHIFSFEFYNLLGNHPRGLLGVFPEEDGTIDQMAAIERFNTTLCTVVSMESRRQYDEQHSFWQRVKRFYLCPWEAPEPRAPISNSRLADAMMSPEILIDTILEQDMLLETTVLTEPTASLSRRHKYILGFLDNYRALNPNNTTEDQAWAEHRTRAWGLRLSYLKTGCCMTARFMGFEHGIDRTDSENEDSEDDIDGDNDEDGELGQDYDSDDEEYDEEYDGDDEDGVNYFEMPGLDDHEEESDNEEP